MSDPSPLNSNSDLAGRPLGGYAVLRKIGSGGMADVYLAEQQSLGRQIALKVLHSRLAENPSYVQRFNNEARAAAALVHPNIVQIYEVGESAGQHFIAQEFVAGKNLDQILQRQGTLEPGTVLDILRQVVSALCQAAEVGIVHRDIKPANILLSPTGVVKVADFGLARMLSVDSKTLTEVGVALGTPLYMSPEQIEGRPVDARSDIYSLGVTCYHLLSGVPPHAGETALAIAMQHLNREPTPLGNVQAGLPEEFVAVVHRMIAKQPADRYDGPSDLMRDLKVLATSAAQDGWAAGSEEWSLLEWISADGSRTAANAQLGQLMREQTKLESVGWNWQRVAGLVAIALLAGGAIAFAVRPRFVLEGTSATTIPKRDSPAAQLFHAKMTESEAAWRAVWENFPDADAYYKQLAEQGLVRHFLFDSPQYDQALSLATKLAEEGQTDDPLRAFALAARFVSLEQLGRQREAREIYSQITPSMKDQLNRFENQLYVSMQGSLSRLGE
ncbi:serine/threonine-protein kinase [Bythopirellula polymerisocia]|uniref:non-specific serine/threonine protein kinase n=1 Tax=Bythopirellula polymerisocia TaxID=2528003 RepID=A0A5C6CDL6_9BACT|nr:serine/threonine-protein kinase [Bythopirellula polymerisocia]TWU22680.1 Serine/threonine-protein kinase PrkC [Bythopirellula polymerisocia]